MPRRVLPFATAGLSVDGLSRRSRRTAPIVVLAVVAATLVGFPSEAVADPKLPPGATAKPPVQKVWPANVDGAVSTARTQGRRGPGVAEESERPVPDLSAEPVDQTLTPVAPGTRDGGFTPGQSVEDVSARTPTSMVFVNPDGTRTLRAYNGVAFVPDGAGGMRWADPTLARPAGSARLAPVAASAVSFASVADDPELMRLQLGGGRSVAFGVNGAAVVGASADGDVARYSGLRSGADLELSATATGMKETLVLRSPSAPQSWLFPLRLQGLRAIRDAATGSVLFVEGADSVVAAIPPGFMEDSSFDPRTGAPARSNKVTYTLVGHGSGTALRVDLDAGWLADPARVWPVRVDPTVATYAAGSDDTFVSSRDYANRNNSSETELLAGTYNSGGEKSVSFLHFNSAMSALTNKYIVAANLNLYNQWSFSCTAKPVTLHRVTSSWSGSTTTTWAGPSYESTALDTRSFAYGYTSCPTGGWGTFQIPRQRMTDWVHGVQSFHGFTVRASLTDSRGWKRFWSQNYGTTSRRPYLEVTYADQGAAYSLPSPTFNPPVTPIQSGKITVRVKNWGTTTWTPTNNYRLTFAILNSSGTVVQNGPMYNMPANVGPHQTADIPITIGQLPFASYTLRLNMVNPSGQSFQSTYGVAYGLYGFSIVNGPPTATAISPVPNGHVDTLRPTLWGEYFDPDGAGTAKRFKFKVCNGTPAAPTGCQGGDTMAWQSASTWVVPSGVLTWSKESWWQIKLSDGTNESAWSQAFYFTPVVAQPEVTSHLAGAPEGGEMPGVNPQVGNYSTTATEAAVSVAGPTLAVQRTYNSQDPRTSGAFGAGWSTPWDQRVVSDQDGSGNVVVTTATGLEVRFGKNTDGTYSAPQGQNLTLVKASSRWVLRDASGYRRVFDGGDLSSVTDAHGRTQYYTYDGTDKLLRVTDVASGRALHLTWTGSRITAVATDPAAPGQPAPTWTYGYTGDKLTSVCTPLGTGSCTTYTYTSASHYRSVVIDDNPTAYWPLGEADGTSVATNVVARSPEENDATYSSDVNLGVAGAVAGSPDTAADLSVPTSPIALPDGVMSKSVTLAAELWFKVGPGSNGYLMGEQNGEFLAAASESWPMLYVGTDGKLRGFVPIANPSTAMVGHSGSCADISGSSTANGTKIQMWTCNGSGAQAWSWYADGTLRALGKCMDIKSAGTANGTLVQLHTCHGGANQVWEPNGTTVRNPVSGRCLHAANATSGTQLVIQDCAAGANQNWSQPVRTPPITTTGTVNDGNWHHVVLSAAVDHQELYLDGVQVGSITGRVIDHHGADKTYVGNGLNTIGWPAGPVGRFNGQIDEVAVYRHPLGSGEVAAHWAARNATDRLVTVAEPGPHTTAAVAYDAISGRVTTLTDRHGAVWNLSPVTLGTEHRQLTVSSSVADSITYTYDAKNNGRLVSRADGFGQRAWTYNDNGFAASTSDENGNVTTYETDDRGNVTKLTTCRVAPTSCQSRYFGYHLNAADPLDPRNDMEVWSSDARSANASDTTYRTSRVLNDKAQVTQITYPKPAGQSTNPTESYTYTNGTGGTQPFTRTTASRTFLTADATVLTLTGDENTQAVSLPFPVWFYGHTYLKAWVSTNGFMSFNKTGGFGTLRTGLPDIGALNNALYPYWDDLEIDASASVRTATTGSAPNRKFIVEWRNAKIFGTTNRITAEVVIAESGEISFNYGGLDNAAEQGATATVGVENAPGTLADQYSYLASTLASGTAIVYTPNLSYNAYWPAYAASTNTQSFTPVTGEALPLTGDDSYTSFSLPFPVRFYGRDYTQAWASTNGFVAFADPGGSYFWTTGVSSTSQPNNVVAPFWDDLVVDGSASVRTATTGTAPNRSFIVEWRNVYHIEIGPGDRLDIQVTFSESGTITFNYANIGTDPLEQGIDAAVSIEDANGIVGMLHSYRDPVLASNLAIVFTPTTVGNTAPAPAGLMTSHTDRNSAATTYTYNAAGDLLTTTDPAGLVTTNAHDKYGRITSTAQSATVNGTPVNYGTTTFTYNALSQFLTTTGPAVVNPVSGVTHRMVTTNTYDNAGRRTREEITDAIGGDPARVTQWGYDPAGRLISTTAADSNVVTQDWNAAGDMTRKTMPGGLVLEYQYDDAHRPLLTKAVGSGVDPMNPAAEELVLERREYDPAGRLATMVDAMGRVTTFTYYGDNLLNTTTRERTDPTPDLVVETRAYDAAGNPTTVTTAGGMTTTYTFDAAGNVATQAFDPSGLNRVTTHSYNADSTVHHTQMTGSASPGRTERVDHTYDPAGRELTTTVYNTGGTPALLTTTRARDPRGLVTRETDPTGVATDYTYDATGALVDTTGTSRTVWVNGTSTSASPVTTLGRNTFGEVTHQRDPNQAVTTTAYDAMGRPTTMTLPSYTPPGGSAIASSTSTTYNAQGLQQSTTDALGRVTTLAYDKYGRLVSRTFPDPDGGGPKAAPVWNHAYSRAGELLDTTDPAGAHTLATYDELGRQATATLSERISGTPVYFTTEMGYDDAGRMTTVKSPLLRVTGMEYSAAGERTKVTDPTNRFVRTSYDLAGRITATVAGRGATYASPVSVTSYDLAGRRSAESECTATATGTCGTTLRTRAFAFDAAGRPTAVTSPVGRPTFYGYDGAGMLTSVTQRVTPSSAATAVAIGLGYDGAGRRTRMVDGNGNATVYTYTPWGLPESTIEPSTVVHPNAADRTWTTVYNAAGLPVEERLPGGVTRTRTYDNLGRLTGEAGTGAEAATTARSLDYDALGRVVSAASPAGNHTFAWNDRGLLASSTGYGGGATFGYDAEGKVTGRTDGSGAVTFGYDDAGRITSIVDPLTGQTATRAYDDAGRLNSITYGSGNPTRTITYDNLGRVDTDTWRRPNNTVSASVDYNFDLDDLLTQKTTTGVSGAGANTYGYDGLGRVTSWLSPGGVTTTYGWDAASNRTTVTTPAGTRTSTYDARNRIVSTSGAGGPVDNYAWSSRGSLISATRNGQTTVYQFDAFERLASVARTGGYSVAFGYDSLDRAARRNTSSFAYADLSNNPVMTPVAAGETKLLRDPTGTALSTKTGSATASTVLGDLVHGDISATAGPTTGDLGASASYDPWGAPTGSGTLPAGFQGGYTDPDSGLVNAHARWYDPALGAFTSRDTWTLEPDPLAAANRYVYANASPLSGADPTGHMLEAAGGGGGAPKKKNTSGRSQCPVCYSHPVHTPTHDYVAEVTKARKKLAEQERRKRATQCPICLPSRGHSQPFDYVAEVEKHRRKTVAVVVITNDRNGNLVLTVLPTCDYDNAYATYYCQSATGQLDELQVGALPREGIGNYGVEAYKPGDTVTDPVLWAEVRFGRPIEEIPDQLIKVALREWYCYYEKATCDRERKEYYDKFWEQTWKDLTGWGDLEDCIRAIAPGGEKGNAWGCAWTAVNAAGLAIPVLKGVRGLGLAGGAAGNVTLGEALRAGGRDLAEALRAGLACTLPGRHSFHPDTRVVMANRTTKPIKAVKPGDTVLATEPKTGRTAARTVTATHINLDRHLTALTVRQPDGTLATLHTTPNHQIWDATDKVWADAGRLQTGRRLGTADGTTATVTAAATYDGTRTMHDLTIATTHTYYVMAGTTPVLVHNTDGCGDGFDDLRLKTQHFRDENGLPVAGSPADTRTVAAFEYTTAGGRSRTIVLDNIPRNTPGMPAGLHAEIRINRILQDRGIDPRSVTRVYADRPFCPICDRSLGRYGNAEFGSG